VVREKVDNTATATLGIFAGINEARPHLLARTAAAIGERGAEARAHAEANRAARAEHRNAAKAGCTGAFAANNCAVVATVSTGCNGGTGFAVMPKGSKQTVLIVPTVNIAPTPMPLPPATDKMGAGFIQRAMVHRQLNKALRRGTLSPEDKANAERVMADAGLYEKAVDASTKIIAKAHASGPQPTVGALGDGHILQMLVDNLPAILAAIKTIIAMFG
jgi:hypothetical protein